MVAHDTRSRFFGLSLECLNDKLNNIASPCLFFFLFSFEGRSREKMWYQWRPLTDDNVFAFMSGLIH